MDFSLSAKISSQPVRQRYFRIAAAVIFLAGLAVRLHGLDVFITADEAKSWTGRSITFLAALIEHDWFKTFDTPAPGVTTMWSGAFGLLLAYFRSGEAGGSIAAFLRQLPFDPIQPSLLPNIRLAGALVSAFTVLLTYRWGRRVWGETFGLLAAGLLAFDPFYLALSRVLGHDALVTSFMWLSLLAALIALPQNTGERNKRPWLFVSGMLAGLAFLTKYPALFLGMFIVCTLLLLALRKKKRESLWPEWPLDVLTWCVGAGLLFVLVFPAMWVQPFTIVSAILTDALKVTESAHQKGSFFMGQAVDDPGSLFYGLVFLFRSTPILLAGVILGVIRAVRRRSRAEWIILAYIVLYSLMVTIGGKKQDRYLLPVYPALAALASLGWLWLGEGLLRLKQSFRSGSIPLGFVAGGLLLLGQAAFVLPHHPYYFTYYSPLFGGGAAAQHILPIGWGEGLDQAARWLNSLPDAGKIHAVSWYSTAFEPFFNGQTIYKINEEKISRSAKPGLAADYVIFYINQVQRDLPSQGALQYFHTQTPAYTVTMHGIDYAWIYRTPGMQSVYNGEVRLVGQAELLGYSLLDDRGQPLTQLCKGGSSTLSLYWEWLGKAQEDPILISLLDETGKTRGWGNLLESYAPLPFSQWKEGMIVRSDFALYAFDDTPDGTYRLSSWIDRPAKKETVGVFPADNTALIAVQSCAAK
jgi:hypothetical protein